MKVHIWRNVPAKVQSILLNMMALGSEEVVCTENDIEILALAESLMYKQVMNDFWEFNKEPRRSQWARYKLYKAFNFEIFFH